MTPLEKLSAITNEQYGWLRDALPRLRHVLDTIFKYMGDDAIDTINDIITQVEINEFDIDSVTTAFNTHTHPYSDLTNLEDALNYSINRVIDGDDPVTDGTTSSSIDVGMDEHAFFADIPEFRAIVSGVAQSIPPVVDFVISGGGGIPVDAEFSRAYTIVVNVDTATNDLEMNSVEHAEQFADGADPLLPTDGEIEAVVTHPYYIRLAHFIVNRDIADAITVSVVDARPTL